jgi:mannosyltransferase
MLTQEGTAATAAPRRTLREWQSAAGVPMWVFWLLPVLLTAALGLYRATSIVLWWDELSTIDVAQRPIGGILATAHHVDAVHTVYYLFMHFWIAAFGTAPLTVRLPSVFAMCGATVCTTAIARRLFGMRVAVTASTIFALIPGVARYACEARSYGFVVLGSAAAFLLLLRALERPGGRRWALYGLVLALTGALNLIALTALAGHALTVLLRVNAGPPARRRALLKPFAVVIGLVLLVDAPIIVLGAMEARSQLGDPPSSSLANLPLIWRETSCSTAFAVLVLFALPLLATHRRRGPALAVIAWATLPVLTLWLISLYGLGFDAFARYLLFVLPAWAIAVAASVDRFRGMPLAGLLAMIMVTAVVVTHDQVVLHGELSHFDYDYPVLWVPAEDYPAAASIVEAEYRPGDAASFSASPHLELGMNDYLPADEQLHDVMVTQTDAQNHTLVDTFCTNPFTCVANAPDRVWMFEEGGLGPYSSEPVEWALALMLHYRIVEVWHVTGITITLLEH